MKPIKFKEANHDLIKPEGMTEDCGSLPVCFTGTEIVSLWRMTWKERISALLFGKTWLSVYSTHSQPPVALSCRKRYFYKLKN
jgi:hypothetical protein